MLASFVFHYSKYSFCEAEQAIFQRGKVLPSSVALLSYWAKLKDPRFAAYLHHQGQSFTRKNRRNRVNEFIHLEQVNNTHERGMVLISSMSGHLINQTLSSHLCRLRCGAMTFWSNIQQPGMYRGGGVQHRGSIRVFLPCHTGFKSSDLWEIIWGRRIPLRNKLLESLSINHSSRDIFTIWRFFKFRLLKLLITSIFQVLIG